MSPLEPTGPGSDLSPRTIANRRNARKSTGPTTPEGKASSRSNAWKHGLRAETLVDPADLQAVDQALTRYKVDLRPECHIEADLVRSAAVSSVRKRRCEQAEQAALVPNAAAAVRTWEIRRRKAIRRQAQDLPQDPSGVLCELEASSFGCDWLIRRWEALDRPLANGLGWSSTDLAGALLLLGQAPDEPDAPLAAEFRRLADAIADATSADASRAMLRSLIAEEIVRLDALSNDVFEAVDLPEREAVRLSALTDASKQGQLRHRYDRDAELSTHRNINLLLRLRRDQARLEARALDLARASNVARTFVGGGWWTEAGATPAPPGYVPAPRPAPVAAQPPARPPVVAAESNDAASPTPDPDLAHQAEHSGASASRPALTPRNPSTFPIANAPNEAKSPTLDPSDSRSNPLQDHGFRPQRPDRRPVRIQRPDPGPAFVPQTRDIPPRS